MNEIALPKKIKTVAWIMILNGIIIPLSLIRYIKRSIDAESTIEYYETTKWIKFKLVIIITSVLFIPLAIFLFRRKKWAWIASVILFLFIISCVSFFTVIDYYRLGFNISNSILLGFFLFPTIIIMQIIFLNFYLMSLYILPFSQVLIFFGVSFVVLFFFLLLPLILLFIKRKQYWGISSWKGWKTINYKEPLVKDKKEKLKSLIETHYRKGVITSIILGAIGILLPLWVTGVILKEYFLEKIVNFFQLILPSSLSFVPYLVLFFGPGILGIIGLILGIRGLKPTKRKMAIWGVILCIIALLIWLYELLYLYGAILYYNPYYAI